jgi:hypothetical protein
LSNYRPTEVTRGGRPVRASPLTAADYNATPQTVTLHPSRLLPLHFHYKLVVNGTSATGVAEPSGVLLDGNFDGIPGGDYARVFGRAILAGANRPGRQRGHDPGHPSPPGLARAIPHSGRLAAPQARASTGPGVGVTLVAGRTRTQPLGGRRRAGSAVRAAATAMTTAPHPGFDQTTHPSAEPKKSPGQEPNPCNKKCFQARLLASMVASLGFPPAQFPLFLTFLFDLAFRAG